MNWIVFVLFALVSFSSCSRGYDEETKDIIDKFRFLQEEINILKQNNDVLILDIRSLKQDNDILKRDNVILKRDNTELKQEIGVLKRDNGVLKLDNDVLKQEVGVLSQDSGVLKQGINVLKGNQAVLKREIRLQKRDNDILTRNDNLLKQDVMLIMHDNSLMKEDIAILRQQLTNKSNVEESLQTELDALHSTIQEEVILHDSQQAFSTRKRLLESGVPEQLFHKIAFSVALTHDVTLGYHQTIEYNKVLTNIGNAYDTADGHFTVPAKGLYLLSVTIFNALTDIQPIEMVRNGIQICALYSNYNDYNMSSQTILVVLEVNDKVWVRRFRDQSSASLYNRPLEAYNTFSGVLLFEM